MKRLLICSTIILLGFSLVNIAQTKKATPKPKYKPSPVYLGKSELRVGQISKKMFDSLVMQGLTAIDSSGIVATVIQFRVYYKERNLYEDSVGRMYFDTELLTDFSRGNKLNSYMGSSLTDRTKQGDTAIFDDIVVMMPDSATVPGLPMSFYITK